MKSENSRDELNALLNTMYSQFLPSEDVLKRLWLFSEKVRPKYLFRYRKHNNYALEDLKNDTATFSLAKNFIADPEDCAIHDHGGLDYAVNTIISSNPKDDLLKIQIANLSDELKNADLKSLRDSEAILCLTDSPMSEHLWEKYIDGSGADFCIEYDADDLRISRRSYISNSFILPVVYTDHLPETNQLNAWLKICSLPFENLNLQAIRFGIKHLNLPGTTKKQLLKFLSVCENSSSAQIKSIFEGLAYIDFIRTVFYKLSEYREENEWRVITSLRNHEDNPEHPARHWPASKVIIKDSLCPEKISAIKNVAHCPIEYLENIKSTSPSIS